MSEEKIEEAEVIHAQAPRPTVLVIGTGGNRYHADSQNWSGMVNGRPLYGGFSHSEMDKVRIGTKILLNPRDPVRATCHSRKAVLPWHSLRHRFARICVDDKKMPEGKLDWGS